MYHGGDRLDIIEMGHRKLRFKLGVGCDADNAGIFFISTSSQCHDIKQT